MLRKGIIMGLDVMITRLGGVELSGVGAGKRYRFQSLLLRLA